MDKRNEKSRIVAYLTHIADKLEREYADSSDFAKKLRVQHFCSALGLAASQILRDAHELAFSEGKLDSYFRDCLFAHGQDEGTCDICAESAKPEGKPAHETLRS